MAEFCGSFTIVQVNLYSNQSMYLLVHFPWWQIALAVKRIFDQDASEATFLSMHNTGGSEDNLYSSHRASDISPRGKRAKANILSKSKKILHRGIFCQTKYWATGRILVGTVPELRLETVLQIGWAGEFIHIFYFLLQLCCYFVSLFAWLETDL